MARANPIAIVGLTGTNGAGKGTVARFLTDRGYAYHSCSDMLREELKRRGQPENLDTLTALGNELRAQEGPGVLARRLLAQIRDKRTDRAVVDSIRNPAEVEALRSADRFVLVAVDAPIDLRWARVQERNRPGDRIPFEAFQEKERVQLSGAGHQQNLKATIGAATVHLDNSGSIPELHGRLIEALQPAGFPL